MDEVYDQAAVRHFVDAGILEERRRLANADQLYGLAAECAIKWVWSSLPNPMVQRSHINQIWGQLPLQQWQKRYPGLYRILKSSRPFDGWSVEQRYGRDDVVSETMLAGHREAAKRILGSVGLLGGRRKHDQVR